jgi:RecB family exonuclease
MRRAASRAAVLQVLAASGRSVAFAHRAEAQAARRPSRWFLGWAGQLAGAGAPLGGDDLEPAAGPWLTVVPSFAATACGGVAGSVQERRLAALAGTAPAARFGSPVVLGHPPLRRAMEAALARSSDRFTAWDGLLTPGLPLDDEVSASALEEWATCPQRYLLGQVLRVAPTAAPADALDVGGGDRGTLAHAALAAVVRRGLGRPPDQPWDEGDRSFLRADLRRRAEVLRRQGRLGSGVLAELRIDELQAALLAALDLDDADRAEEGWVPDDVERGFGERHGLPVAVGLPSGRTVRFRGRIDRIDRVDTAAGGRVRVVDYKTGRGKRYLEATAGGAAAARLLQLGVYEAAARTLHPGAAVSSGWWLLEALERDGRPRPIQPNHLDAPGFTAAIDAIAAGIEGGAFPADPGEDGYRGPENCRFCAFDRVCRVDRVRALRRKASDPALEPWRSLSAVGQGVVEADE